MKLLATSGTPEDLGGLVILGVGVVFYGLIALKDWLKDVRYYRARRVVRSRESIR